MKFAIKEFSMLSFHLLFFGIGTGTDQDHF